MAARHPEWKQQEPFRSILKSNPKRIAASGEAGSTKRLAAARADMKSDWKMLFKPNAAAAASH